MPNRAVVITVSDRCSRGEVEDRSGPVALEHLQALDAACIHREIVPDDVERIRAAVRNWVGRCELIVTSGGTGLAQRDVTPEAIEPLIERRLPGFGEAMRIQTFRKTPLSILSRGGGGVARSTLVIWIPGSPKAVAECLEALTPAIRHACQFLRGDRPH
ncbi:MAG: MogA/MoaB family molybdenum cofactor biosynthesis protein [Phycisphaerae bacterium]